MSRSLLLSAAAIALMAGNLSAQACQLDVIGNPGQWTPQVKLPSFPRASGRFDSIVGVWQASLSVSGVVILNTIDTWNGDGTEFLSADKDPIEGNICQGVWKTVGARGVELHHMGWTFDTSGNPTGTLVDDTSVTLDKKRTTYTGTFDFKFYDQNGNLVKEVTGDTSATRITVQ
ncbi:MAG TPA: hypothetical protein VHT03_06265 [Rhizomicrobium sp.]|jgi:hypothetical protein|nr:hypothetical protein [Rhizomicrobium sp.]